MTSYIITNTIPDCYIVNNGLPQAIFPVTNSLTNVNPILLSTQFNPNITQVQNGNNFENNFKNNLPEGPLVIQQDSSFLPPPTNNSSSNNIDNDDNADNNVNLETSEANKPENDIVKKVNFVTVIEREKSGGLKAKLLKNAKIIQPEYLR